MAGRWVETRAGRHPWEERYGRLRRELGGRKEGRTDPLRNSDLKGRHSRQLEGMQCLGVGFQVKMEAVSFLWAVKRMRDRDGGTRLGWQNKS